MSKSLASCLLSIHSPQSDQKDPSERVTSCKSSPKALYGLSSHLEETQTHWSRTTTSKRLAFVLNVRSIFRRQGSSHCGPPKRWYGLNSQLGLLWWLSDEEPACQFRKPQEKWVPSQVREIPWRRKWQPTPVFLPGESHGHGGVQSIA